VRTATNAQTTATIAAAMNIVCGVIEMLSARLPVDGEPEALSSMSTGTPSSTRLLRVSRGERVRR
jgi:hypothetical protein